ncbi:hypothetical protein BC830DRAFT_1170632 [Chytriomyces sp. MP71]|nr:hypothetical protein BC830DRAFT_1170632 [Chytriomyces sp. MP71]
MSRIEELEFNQAVLLLQKEKIALQMPAYEDASATYHAPHRVDRNGGTHSPRQSVRVSGDASYTSSYHVSGDEHMTWVGVDLTRTSSLRHSVAMHHGLTPTRLSRGSPSPHQHQVPFQQMGMDSGVKGAFQGPLSPLGASSALPVPIDMSWSNSAPAKKGSVFNLLRVKKSQHTESQQLDF